jgi:hypothetical protein
MVSLDVARCLQDEKSTYHESRGDNSRAGKESRKLQPEPCFAHPYT